MSEVFVGQRGVGTYVGGACRIHTCRMLEVSVGGGECWRWMLEVFVGLFVGFIHAGVDAGISALTRLRHWFWIAGFVNLIVGECLCAAAALQALKKTAAQSGKWSKWGQTDMGSSIKVER